MVSSFSGVHFGCFEFIIYHVIVLFYHMIFVPCSRNLLILSSAKSIYLSFSVLIYTLLILILFQSLQSTVNCSLIPPEEHLPSDFSILPLRLDSDIRQVNTPQQSYFPFYQQQPYGRLIIRMTHNIINCILIHI